MVDLDAGSEGLAKEDLMSEGRALRRRFSKEEAPCKGRSDEKAQSAEPPGPIRLETTWMSIS